jgi:hypothetical protein
VLGFRWWMPGQRPQRWAFPCVMAVLSGSCGPFAGHLAECGDFINWSMGCCMGVSLVGSRWRSTSRTRACTALVGVVESSAKALHWPCRCQQGWHTSVVSLLGGARRGAPSTPLWWVWALREKSLAPASRAGDGGGCVVTFLEASSWRPWSAVK